MQQIDSKKLFQLDLPGKTVFYSYQTPIVVLYKMGGVFITNKNYSVTTSKHLNYILRNFVSPVEDVKKVSQSELENLIRNQN